MLCDIGEEKESGNVAIFYYSIHGSTLLEHRFPVAWEGEELTLSASLPSLPVKVYVLIVVAGILSGILQVLQTTTMPRPWHARPWGPDDGLIYGSELYL